MNQVRFFRFVLEFFVFLFLGIVCAPQGGLARHKSPFGTPVDRAKLSQIKIGETSRAEVEQILGQAFVGARSELSQEVTLQYFSQPPSTQESVPDQVVDKGSEAGMTAAVAGPQAARAARAAAGKLVVGAPSMLGPAVLVGMLVTEMCWPHHFKWEQHLVALKFNAEDKLMEIGTQDESSAGGGNIFSLRETLGEKIDFAKVDQIQAGKSTAVDVEQLLGPPISVIKTLQDVTWGYQYSQYHSGLSGGTEPPQVVTAEVKLDLQGKVLKVSKDAYSAHLVQRHVLHQHPIARDNLLKIQVGKTTRGEVEQLLGPPTIEGVIERENSTETRLVYLWHRPEKGLRLGLHCHFSVTLDQNGVVKEVE